MQNILKKKRLRLLALLLALSLPIWAWGQGGLFKRGSFIEGTDYNKGLFRNGETTTNLTNQTFGNYVDADDITNQTFGAPLGNGVLVLLTIGAGYATIESRKRNKNKETIK